MKMQTSKAIEVIPDIAFELFGDHPCRFRQYLFDQNYAEATVRKYMLCIGVLAEMMKAEKIALEELDETQALALVAKTGWIEKRRTYAACMARRFVQFLREQGAGKPPLPPTAKDIARAELRQD